MKVILRETVAHVGDIGDLVNVKDGYARNFLLPRGLAVVANDRQIRRMEHEKRAIESKVAKMRVGAEAEAGKLNKVTLTVAKAVGENEKLFGSVTSMELEAMLKEEGYDINRRQILLSENIKQAGIFEVPVKLHRDVTATIKVHVVAKNPAPVAAEIAEPAADKVAEAVAE